MSTKPAMTPRHRVPTAAATLAPLPMPASTQRLHMRAKGEVAHASSAFSNKRCRRCSFWGQW